MEFLRSLASVQIAPGTSLGDVLTIQFVASVVGDVLAAILILVVTYILAGWLRGRITHLSDRYERLDRTLFRFFGNVARYAVLIIGFIIVLNTFGVQTTSLVALIGAAGLAIGLALQGTLTNVAAGVMLIFFRPFKVGDFIDAGGHVGTVVDVNLMLTELQSIGNTQIILPNSEVWNAPIVNYSTYPTRRAEWTFGVGYGANLADADRIIRETIESDDRTHADPAIWCQVNNLGDSSVDFLVRAWCDRTDYWDYQADMKRRVKEALDAGGVDIPFPTRTVHQLREGES